MVGGLGLSGVGAGTADAKWSPTPIYYNIFGNDQFAAGNGCHGPWIVGISDDRAKPGKIRVTVRSRGFTKNNCKVRFTVDWLNGAAPLGKQKHYTVSGTKKPGKVLLQKEIWIGSGLAMIVFRSGGPVQKPTGGYIWVT